MAARRLLQKSITNPAYARFRSLLIEARQSADLTQVELAKKIGKPQSYVSKYETGERRLDVVEFIAIARTIGIDPVGLFQNVARMLG